MPRTFLAVFLVILVLVSPMPVAAQSGGTGDDGEDTTELYLEVEGRPLLRPEDVLFYGDRVPRSHFYGDRYIPERRFFEIAGDEDAARRSRNHRALNIGIGAIAILSFFSGLVLFSAADDVDLTDAGIDHGISDRGFSLLLLGGSLVPTAVLTARRQYWAPLEYTYQTMESYNTRR